MERRRKQKVRSCKGNAGETWLSGKVIRRVEYLVGHHHTYKNIDGMDYQILVEADFLVNLFEDGSTPDMQKNVFIRNFRTEGGKRLFRLMFESGENEK